MYQAQIAPQSQSQTSAKNELTVPLCMELFTRFFTRVLEKDPKLPSYLHQWTEFKNLMTQTPFDLDNLFIHLATIQINLFLVVHPRYGWRTEKVNLDKASSNPSPPKSGEVFLQIPGASGSGAQSHRAKIDDYKMTVRHSNTTGSNISPSPRSRARSTTEFLANPSWNASSTDLERSRRTSIQIANDELSRVIEHHHTSINVLNPALTPSQIFEASELNLVKTRSNELTEHHAKPEFAHFMESFKKADLSFLASKARGLRENISIHNDKAVDAFQNKKQKIGGFQLEERTPLRRLVVYAATDKTNENKTKQQQQQVHQAVEQFSLQFQGNPNTLNYNTKLLHY